MSGSTATLDVARRFVDALNQGDKEALLGLLSQEAVWYSVASGEIDHGRADTALNLLAFRGSFPDLHEEISNAFSDGHQVALETVATGTYDGKAFPTISGSGRHVTVKLCYILRVRDGLIGEITTYMDYRSLMVQLDMIMTPSPNA